METTVTKYVMGRDKESVLCAQGLRVAELEGKLIVANHELEAKEEARDRDVKTIGELQASRIPAYLVSKDGNLSQALSRHMTLARPPI